MVEITQQNLVLIPQVFVLLEGSLSLCRQTVDRLGEVRGVAPYDWDSYMSRTMAPQGCVYRYRWFRDGCVYYFASGEEYKRLLSENIEPVTLRRVTNQIVKSTLHAA